MEDVANIGMWVGFSVFLVFALSIDTFFSGKHYARPHESMQASLTWTLVWVTTALLFNGFLWVYLYSTTTLAIANEKSLQFLTGYLIEKSLSVDNLFVFFMIFHQFHIPLVSQQRVLTIGIWSAIVMRLVMILLGVWLVSQFHWLLYLMGAFLVVTGIKMCFLQDRHPDLADSLTIRCLKRIVRITNKLHEQHFFIRQDFRLYATPLFVVLVLVEISDLIFATDSIPAIFAITRDPFIIWSSNIFAILGLRALYFLLAKMVHRFELLKYGIALILVFIGGKMMLEPWLVIPVMLVLGVIAGILAFFVSLSWLLSAKRRA
ncbi:MAG: hypothetical protein A3E85_04495 [Gammaproteobacteria bacterium RIFCSPHIGHO2_12_FULL_45_12]|nr:MAG: hypothetical protein A3E85_04495 [Gammaproteobacteria bacterium RIFCSPHIGHO2_12_FULL_45_12]